MKNLKTATIFIFSLLLLLGTIFFVLGFTKPKPAGVSVKTSPESNVYLDGVLVGKTPFKTTHAPGEVSIKLVPESGEKKLLTFETKISLVAGVETLVRREFGETEDGSAGDIISYDKTSSGETSLVVVTTPADAQISLDGVPRGFSPYKTSVISPVTHLVSIKSPGYNERSITLVVAQGLRLTVFAKLSKAKEMVLEPTPTPSPEKVVYVEILNTPTGFLRVRTQPGSSGDEIAEVKPGSKYLFLQKDEASGWYQIQYGEAKPGLPNGITGWVAGQYAKLVNGNGDAVDLPSETSDP